uniref:Large ribosomal subunit protein uL4 C-terminal domain-containing protein n=1 Tax=Pseudictyota dubia TaxID=2749911 RepID=A0A7R9Z9I7_9STRA
MAAAARPLVNVYDGRSGETAGTTELPAVFTAPIRADVVHFVHTQIAKNKRQAYAVNKGAGHQTSAESWGTGRAVARIPRVGGGGTHRSGQGAFGNMCRGGRMFAPTKTWRKWHRQANVNQRRYALVSALAASAVPSLVLARGHRVEEVQEIPLVLSNIEDLAKTRDAVAVLGRFGAGAELEKCAASKKIRAGKGKMRNRRYVTRRGPLVVHAENLTIDRAFRNLPGLEICHVDRLNLLQVAPGGHLGRFIIWTQGAFEKLDALYGTYEKDSTEKVDYRLPRPVMTNADLGRLINASEIQNVLRPKKDGKRFHVHKKNPLANLGALVKLNPYAMKARRTELLAQKRRSENKAAVVAAKRGLVSAEERRSRAAASKAFYNALLSDEYTKPKTA